MLGLIWLQWHKSKSCTRQCTIWTLPQTGWCMISYEIPTLLHMRLVMSGTYFMSLTFLANTLWTLHLLVHILHKSPVVCSTDHISPLHVWKCWQGEKRNISMINTTKNFFICRYFSIYEQLKFRAQFNWAWKKFYKLRASSLDKSVWFFSLILHQNML